MMTEERREPSRSAPDAAKAYVGRTILLTGGRGYLGAALAEQLAAVDCELVLCDRSNQDAWQPKHLCGALRHVRGDVSDRATWSEALCDVDVVFHLAACEHTHGSNHAAEQDLAVNAGAVLHCIEACRAAGRSPRIVHASSANLYGCASELPVREDAPDRPLTLFAVHKAAAETYLRLFAPLVGYSAVTLRLANVYGPTPRIEKTEQVVLNKIITRALAGGPLKLYDNRECIRDYVFIDDVVEAFLLAGSRDAAGQQTYVIGSGEGHTIAEAVQLVASRAEHVTGRSIAIETDATVEIGPAEQRNFVADTGRFEQDTGWSARTRLAEGVDKTIEVLACRS
ncbi:MAG: SDR family NAD(P)-dependent oxidoreductase [Planctomycetota bacterium]|nr:MAG: SDR family NAD(P)-dependent oxidoreductase [Planctomycetota bacterium]REJ97338.1 MAG: SDR family NAD(P)-dependent oxidoreductase [Planctomycetota bacterium]